MASEDRHTPAAEYLVCQSTGTCLSVVSGSGPGDAVVGLAKCTGSSSQRWYVCDGRWQWAPDRSLCLAHKQGELCLAPCTSTTTQASWTLDESGRLSPSHSSLALDVPWDYPRTKVILYPKHSGQNQKWWLLSTLKKIIDDSPDSTPTTPTVPRTLLHIVQGQHQQFSQTGRKPDFLISQSSHTLVTVLSGSGPHDAVVGLAPYTGQPCQQWSLQAGQWKWGQDPSLCLAPSTSSDTLTLASCTSSTAQWTLDNQGVVSCGTRVLDVPWEHPRQHLIVYPRHGGINQKWWNLATLTMQVPSKSPPMNNDSVYMKEMACTLINKLCDTSEPFPIQRTVEHFPGKVSSSAPRITATLTLDLSSLGQRENIRMTAPKDWQATDLYIPDGELFQVMLPDWLSSQQASQISVRVGAHCDTLQPESSNVKGRTFKRIPDITEEFEVKPGINNFRSQFGGNLIFTFEEGSHFNVNIEVKNVVRGLHYILGKTSKEEWERVRDIHKVPHAMLEGKSVVLVVPYSSILALTNPDQLLHRYDQIIHLLNDLAGFGDNDPPPRGKQWLVEDVQISAGSAHAGFPAMFCQEYYELCCPDTPYDWVTWHELGHNFQQGNFWSYRYGSESTVNLFSLYIQETLLKEDRLRKENRYTKTATEVDEGLTFQEADCWQKLVFLMEIKHAYPKCGWEMYRCVSRTTRALSDQQAASLTSCQQRQIDYVYELLSEAVGADLLPHYQRWGLEVSKKAQAKVTQLGLPMSPADLSIRNN
ncbi:hypothetical protein Pmani_023814 [Petrolisthes manimaculis]|uniref:Peptidase M60 domain-containing protein n=1 Tax=Petrolisthes manimaculis TaxID=1843537 RepID=A0AAE1TZX4_9EUCA|nr:hypothetical protein Pmani_023814 [Petrolisthes manimaculis]